MTTILQATFGEVVGLEEFLPIAPHPSELVYCEDTETEERCTDCLVSVDGKFWMDEQERTEHEEQLVKDYLNDLVKYHREYTASEENVSQYTYLMGENPTDYRRNIREALEEALDECDDHDFLTDEVVDDIFEALDGDMACKSTEGYSAPSGIDVTFDSFNWGEEEDQVEINDHELLSALQARNELEDILDNLDREFCFYRPRLAGGKKGDIIQPGYNDQHPSFTLNIDTGLTFYYGCTSEELDKAWNEYAEEHDLPKIV